MLYTVMFFLYLLLDLVSSAPKNFWGVNKGYTEVPEHLIPADVNQLILKGNIIEDVETLTPYPDLYMISLISNLLWQFPNLVNVSSTLERLTLNDNRISTVIPERLSALTLLNFLELSDNRLHAIPNVPMQSLNTLKLGNNNFNAMPEMTKLGLHLTTFAIDKNDIESIDDSYFQNMLNLTILDCSLSGISKFPNLKIIGNTLSGLSASGNPVKKIAKSYLNVMAKMTSVYFENMDLVNFPDFSSSPSKNTLLSLILRTNKITHIPHDALTALSAIVMLNLIDNPLVTLPNLCHIPKPFHLYLSGPSMHCDCHLAWLKRMEPAGMIVAGAFALELCTGPDHLVGVKWSNIGLDNLTCPG